MSFVDWAGALVLLALSVAGFYGAAQALFRRASAYDGTQLSTRGAALLGLLYLAGALVAGLALVLLLSERLS